MKAGLIRTVVGDTRLLDQDELGEFLSLALEIQHAEGLDVDAALDRAAEQLDELAHYYPVDWDRAAFNGGNWEGLTRMPF